MIRLGELLELSASVINQLLGLSLNFAENVIHLIKSEVHFFLELLYQVHDTVVSGFKISLASLTDLIYLKAELLHDFLVFGIHFIF